MKYPKPEEGVTKHCWGKRRRIAKKVEKGLWKAMDRLGILAKTGESAATCSWEERYRYRPGTWKLGSSMRRPLRIAVPYIARWSAPTFGIDDWSESPIRYAAHDHLDQERWSVFFAGKCIGPEPECVAKSDRHALQLLRREIRDRKRQTDRGEG